MYFLNILITLLLININVAKVNTVDNIVNWNKIDEGLYYSEINAPFKSVVGDSKISILKINPNNYSFNLYTASELKKPNQTIKKWSDEQKCVAAINAGMYKLSNNKTCVGYMKNFKHCNNHKFKAGFNSIAAFNRVNNTVPEFQIIDLTVENSKELLKSYHSMFQGIRLIDNNQNPIFWKIRTNEKYSICALAVDKSNNVLFIFTRSPYAVNDLIKMLLMLPLDIHNAMYLEGGPETSFYVASKDTVIEKYGRYISSDYKIEKDDHLWDLPNILGIKNK